MERKTKPNINVESQSDEVTQLERQLFEDKLEKYRQLKQNFEKSTRAGLLCWQCHRTQ